MNFMSVLFVVIAAASSSPGFSAHAKLPSPFNTEVHLQICNVAYGQLKENLGLSSQDRFDSKVYFIDTNELDLYHNKTIVRVKFTDASKAHIDLKLRPVDFERIHPDWFALKGFRCEFDEHINKTVPSCRLRQKSAKSHVTRILRKQTELNFLLNDDQSDLVNEVNQLDPFDLALKAYGPVSTAKWQLDIEATFADELNVEVWFLGEEIIAELSTRCETADKQRALSYLKDFARAYGFDVCENQISKTAATLEHLQSTETVAIRP